MLSRLLMVVGGGSSFNPPSPGSFSITSAPQGGNNPWTVPSAVQVSGTTYFGWVDGNGNLKAATYDSGVLGGPYTIAASFNQDAHDSPAFVRRASDGKWIAFASKHNTGTMDVWVSSNADDFSSWTGPTNLDSQLGGSRYTDYQVFERSGVLTLFVRDEPTAGTDSRWLRSTTSSATPTSGWATLQNTYRIASTRSYCITYYDPIQDRLHLIATNGASAGFTKLGHMYRDMTAGTWHKDDGSTVALTANFTSLTEIYTGSANVFGINLAFDGSGNPVLSGFDGLDYIYLRYDGAAWTTTTITDTGTGYEYNGTGTGFQPWGCALDDSDINVVWLLKDDDGVNPQLWRYTTADGGDTFSGTQVTNDLTGDQTTVICVRDAASEFRAFWQSGSWNTYTSWNMGLTGVGG